LEINSETLIFCH